MILFKIKKLFTFIIESAFLALVSHFSALLTIKEKNILQFC